MNKKFVKFLTVALGVFAGAQATLAAADGDIYEIRPCTIGNVTTGPMTTIAEPLTSGVDLYFRVQLLQRDAGGDPANNWYLKHTGLQSEALDWVSNPLQIGIYVSGQPRYATLVSCTPSATTKYTDLIFTYKTRPGDFALPIVLATAHGPATDDEGSAYLLNNLYDPATGNGAWRITNSAGEDCNFWQWTYDMSRHVPMPEYNTDGRGCGFYVQTIGFDERSYTVHEGSDESHQLIASSPSDDAVTLYVWSKDESRVRVVSDETVMLNLDAEGTSQVETHIGTVTIAGGAVSANFRIEGMHEDGIPADLVLSAWKNYTYRTTGEAITDYVTAPATCIEPLPTVVAVDCDRDTVQVDSDYMISKAKLSVYATQPVGEKLFVTITPTMLGTGGTGNPADYVRLHKTKDSVKTLSELSDSVVIEILANTSGREKAIPVYVYALRGDASSSGAYTIDFVPAISEAQEASTGIVNSDCIPAAATFEAALPKVTVSSTLSATALIEKEIEIAVADTYADQQITDPAAGYKVTVQYDGTGDSKTDLAGEYYITGGVLKDKDGKLPKLTYKLSGEYDTYITVTEPISKLTSAPVLVKATVADANKVYVTSEKKVYNEGDVAEFTIYMNNRNSTGNPIYAFLKPSSTEIKKAMLSAEGGDNFIICSDTDLAGTTGIKIASGDGDLNNPAHASVRLLDGNREEAGGLQFGFDVVLCTSPTYDEANVIDSYTSTRFAIKVLNLEPTIKRLEMNGFESDHDGYEFAAQPKGMEQSFKAIVTDKGSFDLDTDFQTKWTLFLNGAQKKAETITGNPNKDLNAYKFTFNQSGTWTIRAQVKDKDMDDWSAETYSATLEILAQPSVLVTVPDLIDETDNKAKIAVNLSYIDPDYEPDFGSKGLKVRLTVTPHETGDAGHLELGGDGVTKVGANVYEFELADTTPLELTVDPATLDGTEVSETYGFGIKVEVVDETELPTSETKASEYYLSTSARTYVRNMKPVFGNITQPNPSNAWAIAGGVATQYPINWQIKKDVAADLAAGIKITFSGCDNAAAGTTTVYEPQSGTFIPDFGSAQGSQMVTMTIEDKDGASETWTYYYKIEASKFLTTKAVGPSGGTTTAAPTMKYVEAKGLGKGHVYVESATLNSANHFSLRWNCRKDTSKTIWAFGYKTNAVDNGSLDLYDVALTPNGSKWTTGDYYKYDDTELDSFFYTWVFTTSGENGGFTSTVASLSPERIELGPASGLVQLPGQQLQEGGYTETYADAIFSKEWSERPTDNCGDINQDGIPDRFVVQYGFNVYDRMTGEFAGDDLANVAAFNEDEDYLPASSTAGLDLVPTIKSNWPTAGMAFTALLEIRGFGEGLNTEYSEIDFEPDEMRAYLLWKKEQELKATLDPNAESYATNIATQISKRQGELIELADEAVADEFDARQARADKWSPENPTDPTKEDTDGDGLPDGYEYWFWYGAKVGYRDAPPEAGGKWQGLMHGKRFVRNAEWFEDIKPSEIWTAFNPTSPNLQLQQQDFDQDGLYDIEEFTLGTNPVNCDTDGDGLIDGWEVMWGLNPLAPEEEKKHNPDGDFMAEATEFTIFEKDGKTYATGLNLNSMSAGYFRPRLDKKYSVGLLQVGEDGLPMTCGYGMYETEFGEEVPRRIYQNVTRVKISFTKEEIEALDNGTFEYRRNSARNDAYVVLVHDQVFAVFDFDPRTGWGKLSADYVTDRWNPDLNTEAMDYAEAGRAINTKPFTTKEEFWLYNYLKFVKGKTFAPDDPTSILGELYEGTTNPNVPFSMSYGDSPTVYAQEVHGADSDADGMPDGWELYIGLDPLSDRNPPHLADDDDMTDFDNDGMFNPFEFAGSDSCRVYEDVPSIAANNPANRGWLNKFFPTNPYAADTDGDGIRDPDEGAGYSNKNFPWYAGRSSWSDYQCEFIYPGAVYDEVSFCFRGGGMNPCCSDTDFDGLPDAWERQYAGIVFGPDLQPYKPPVAEGEVAETVNVPDMYTDDLKIGDGLSVSNSATGYFIIGGMDPTYGKDARHQITEDERTGTVRDFDFDHDGLENWQEYLTQSVRHWRYDDVDTPLMGRAIIWTGAEATTHLSAPLAPHDLGCLAMNVMDGERFYRTVSRTNLWNQIATAENLYYQDYTTAYPYDQIGYFADAAHEWDIARVLGIKFMLKPSTIMMYTPALDPDLEEILSELFPDLDFGAAGPSRAKATRYATSDPRRWDSDDDGMDDYYEVFHGLNPLLGLEDIVADAYADTAVDGLLTADFNPWVGETMTGKLAIDNPGLDPVRVPWRMGEAMSDPDGDGLRNADEAIMGDMTSPTTYHTDPTPLWMTDRSTPISYVAQYYLDILSNADLAMLPFAGWIVDRKGRPLGAAENVTYDYPLPFEENEGYDTDGDFRGDGHEIVKTVSAITDPLDANDPDRRSAIYFSGENSCAVSYEEGSIPVVDGYDMFRQFTVECWFKADDPRKEQTIIERGFAYPASNYVNSNEQWRANFRIGINEGGVVYGMFDNDNAVESGSNEGVSSQTVLGLEVDNGWNHVALTFDGKALVLYVNGIERGRETTKLIPANGIRELLQNPANTNSFPFCTYATVPGMITLGARRTPGVTEWSWANDFSQVTDFFAGSVSEVRCWDGARTSKEIGENYRKRFSAADIAANWEAVYESWSEDGTRNDNDGADNLPAQLIINYNFRQLPGAVDPADVAKIPSGYDLGVYDNFPYDTDLITIGWWNRTALHSTVYTDYHIVPWIQNAVSHAALFDGSMFDSMFWSNDVAGYTPARLNALESYAIPNSGNPYVKRNYLNEATLHYFRLNDFLAESYPEAEDLADRYSFMLRSNYNVAGDLVPLGDAFARRDSDYWDGDEAMSVWNDTRSDTDGDDIPDWWEDLHGGDVAPTDIITYNGLEMTAAEAYLRDLILRGMLPDGSVSDLYAAAQNDKNGNDLPDWWEELHGISLSEGVRALDDIDGDGLSNFTEYLLAEVLKIASFDPNNAFSVNKNVSDYFYKVGQLYVGEVFTDHDQIDDLWEDSFASDGVSRHLYDANGDPDKDGWSNYAEYQAGTDPTKLGSIGIDGVQMSEYPVPTIELTVSYNQRQNTYGRPIIVKAWSDRTLVSKPDARWTIGTGGNAATDNAGATDAAETNSVKYLGVNPNREMLLHLSPGSVVRNTVKFEFKDINWVLVDNLTGQGYVSDSSTAVWEGFLIDRNGEIVEKTTDAIVGTIDYDTGVVNIDFSKLSEYVTINGDISGQLGGGDVSSIYALPTSYVRVTWQSQPLIGGNANTFYLADADQPSETNNSLGHVKEGRNVFVAFWDLDGNGQYTVGEPYGVAADVDVGWNSAKATIELTDTSAYFARFDCNDGTNDREDLYGTESGNFPLEEIADGLETGGKYERVRIVRTLVDGVGISAPSRGIATRVVLDKMVDLTEEPFITEADFLARGEFDIDWSYLADDIKNYTGPVTSVVYRVVIGNGSVSGLETNNLLNIGLTRSFDSPKAVENIAPVTLGPGEVMTPSPTFTWAIPYGLTSYTAFKIKVYDEKGTEVWDSGYQQMPSRDANEDYTWQYSWTAPILVGQKLNGSHVFENNKGYSWAVSVYNARYKNDKFSARGAFRLSVPQNALDFGVIDVAVRYFGHVMVGSANTVRVEAFETPDFSGVPVAAGYVTNTASLASLDAPEANAQLLGVRPGLYYVRAYIDTQSDGIRNEWESWGCHCTRDIKDRDLYIPVSVRVGPGYGPSMTVDVYIEDCDTDQDNLPDAWEIKQKGNLRELGVTSLDQTVLDFDMNKTLTGTLQATNPALYGLAVTTSRVLSNARVAAQICGFDDPDGLDALGEKSEIAEESIVIMSIDLDTVNAKATLQVAAQVENKAVEELKTPLYTFKGTLSVSCKVWKKTNLDDAEWTCVVEKPVTVGKETASVEVDLKDDVDFSSGFFMITLE